MHHVLASFPGAGSRQPDGAALELVERDVQPNPDDIRRLEARSAGQSRNSRFGPRGNHCVNPYWRAHILPHLSQKRARAQVEKLFSSVK
jgi:hypothetical protein